MAVEKEQIREFLDIESSELKNFIDSIDAEALIDVYKRQIFYSVS